MAFDLNDLKAIIAHTYTYASDLFEVKLGRIEKGYEADFMRLDYTPPTPMHEANAFGHVFFGLFHQLKPKDVYFGGKHTLQDGQVSRQLMALYQEAHKYADLLWKTIKKEEENNES